MLVALIFTPALCATMLKPKKQSRTQTGFFGWFNRNFERTNQKYESAVVHVVHRTGRYLLIFGLIVVLMAVFFVRLPKSFLPDEDQGIIFAQVTSPPGATLERTQKSLDQVREYFLTQEKDSVMGVFTVPGFNFAARGQAAGLVFIRMKDWNERPGKENRVQAVAARASRALSKIEDAQAFAFAPPAALELGNATGFDLELLDRANSGPR